MAINEDLLWDAARRGTPIGPRLRRTAVTAGCTGLFAVMLWTYSGATWAVCAAVAYVLAEFGYRVWDRRRLVEAKIIDGGADGRPKLRIRQAGGRTTEHDPGQVVRVLIIHDNVVDSAKLRLRLRGKRIFFGRPGRSPALTTWRSTCPSARVQERSARWGMPGVPD
ncbi:hypothetical protein [uncultured Streptomyces sp.]|uniref:hypothetical protein n=1 Tax=uncultured Streptomyces sp. TaxID=174707 RepID=UPI00262D9803|nr:hypothetical protein [uncultured Streptomyces sp.]